MFFTRRFELPKQSHRRAGFTLAEVLVSSITLVIIIMGAYFFLGRQSRTVSTEDSKRGLFQRAGQAREIILRELEQIGYNPTGAAFSLPAAPIAGYRPCNDYPVFDPADTRVQSCFGITDARIHKLGFATDTNGNGVVDNPEARALVLKETSSGTMYDPMDLTVPVSPLPQFLSRQNLTNYNHTLDFAWNPPTVFLNRLPQIPELCTLAVGQKYDKQYELMLSSYDPSPATTVNYRFLVGRVLCFNVAYVRMYHDYEICQSCMACQSNCVTGPPVMVKVSNPGPAAGCTPGLPAPFPFLYFTGQIPTGAGAPKPLVTNDEARNGLVFTAFPPPAANQGQTLDPDKTYLTHMVKVALIIEDDKLSPKQGWLNPLTDRPYATERVDMTYYLPSENKPCDKSLGACNFSNRQCNR